MLESVEKYMPVKEKQFGKENPKAMDDEVIQEKKLWRQAKGVKVQHQCKLMKKRDGQKLKTFKTPGWLEHKSAIVEGIRIMRKAPGAKFRLEDLAQVSRDYVTMFLQMQVELHVLSHMQDRGLNKVLVAPLRQIAQLLRSTVTKRYRDVRSQDILQQADMDLTIEEEESLLSEEI